MWPDRALRIHSFGGTLPLIGMISRSQWPFAWRLTAFALFVAAISGGCESGDKIRTYPVAKEIEATPLAAEPQLTKAAANVGEPTDRMVAAVLPAGQRAWFFKVVGPLAAVKKQEKELDAFLNSIILAGNGHPEWKLPDGWKEEQGRGMRAATIRIPAEGEPLELSVIGLPWRGVAGELLANINRWRGQMKLPEVGERQLDDFTREQKVGETTMTIVDLEGRFDAGPAMTPPFARGAAGRPSGTAPPAKSNLPAGHPPVEAVGRANGTAGAGTPKFDAPESWQPLPAGGMRKAAFQVGDQQKGALITVIDFPADAGPMIADPLQNANRWRREVGMPEITEEELDDSLKSIDVGGHSASYVKLVPNAATDATKQGQSQAGLATLAAIVDSGNRIWFFKLSGTPSVVADQEDEFKSFLKSVEFDADGGAEDGDR